MSLSQLCGRQLVFWNAAWSQLTPQPGEAVLKSKPYMQGKLITLLWGLLPAEEAEIPAFLLEGKKEP